MTKSLPLRHPLGMRVDVHRAVPVAFALAVVGLAEARLPAVHPGRSPWVYWAVGLVAAVACFASLLARDGARVAVAGRQGVAVGSFLLRSSSGGTARSWNTAPTPGAELRTAVVGPLVSLGLALVTALSALLVDAAGLSELTAETLAWLAAVNVLLFVGQLLPGAPLDGARLLHALVWRRTGDRSRATAVAGAAGRHVGWPLLLLGLAQVVFADDLGGLWLALTGIFLVATAEHRHP
ncbi:site-2 protease family protein [Streptomyces sp. NPDC017941]|uniref:site-2 protease family protein n=1 Tax=Streptomyces sp. NPDC017941 TaxID=3365018 RepID=UPI0037AB359A